MCRSVVQKNQCALSPQLSSLERLTASTRPFSTSKQNVLLSVVLSGADSKWMVFLTSKMQISTVSDLGLPHPWLPWTGDSPHAVVNISLTPRLAISAV
jgi:hypothetical protein